MDVIIVCHTEFGFVNNKKIIFEKKAHSGVIRGVSNLTRIASKYNAKITFAVCPECLDFFPKKINHEVGLHLHPGWEKFRVDKFEYYVGDEFLWENYDQLNNSSVLVDHNYKEQLELIKLGKDHLDEKLENEVTSFVAGRWSLNNDTIKSLLNVGITHDCTCSPSNIAMHFDWSKLQRLSMPYNPAKNDYQEKGDLKITIVPISQAYLMGNVNPEIIPNVGLKWLKAAFLEYLKCSNLFHICLHSPSMTDPYFIKNLDEFLSFISKYNIKFKFASEIGSNENVEKTNIIPPKLEYFYAINPKVVRTLFNHVITKYIKKPNR